MALGKSVKLFGRIRVKSTYTKNTEEDITKNLPGVKFLTYIVWWLCRTDGPLFTLKTPTYGYRDPYYQPKMIERTPQIFNANLYTNKMVSSYWIMSTLWSLLHTMKIHSNKQCILITHYPCCLRWCYGFVPVFTQTIYYYFRFCWILFDFGLDCIALIHFHALVRYFYTKKSYDVLPHPIMKQENLQYNILYKLGCIITRHNITWYRIHQCKDWRRT